LQEESIVAEKKIPTKKTAGKKPAAKKPPSRKTTVDTAQLSAVFERLKGILKPYAPRMVVVKDDKNWYYLDTRFTGRNKKPIMFAAARVGKGYVSFYLMCVYCRPEWIEMMSPELKKRMQGKACFNFTSIDEKLFAELEELTKTSVEWALNGGMEKVLSLQ
jgi:hypothetical protein